MNMHTQKTVGKNDRAAVSFVRYAFIIALGLLLFVVSVRGQWEAYLITTNGTYITELPNAPIWQAPNLPEYGNFKTSFKQLPMQSPTGATISVAPCWSRMLFEFLAGLWSITALCRTLYLAAGSGCMDRTMHHVLYTGIGLTGGFLISAAIWLMIGGWGPPALVFFGVAGLVLGNIAAHRKFNELTSNAVNAG